MKEVVNKYGFKVGDLVERFQGGIVNINIGEM